LLQHEFLIWWRRTTEKKSTLVLWGIVGLIVLLLLGMTASLVFLLRLLISRSGAPITATGISDSAIVITGGIWLFLFCVSLPGAISKSALQLFDRGDMDLLLSSPISPKVVLASHLLQTALGIFVGYCLYLVPVSYVAIAFGYPQLLGIYPSFIGLSLSVSSVGILLTLWLVRRLGVKRMQTTIQVATILLSGSLYLVSQLPTMLGTNTWGVAGSQQVFQQLFGATGLLRAKSWIWFPARAAFMDIPSVVLTLLVSGGMAWFTVELMHQTFLTGTQQVTTLKSSRRIASSTHHFASNSTLIVLLKEWRTIARSPALLTTIANQLFALAPSLILFHRMLAGNITTLAAIFIPALGGALVLSLTQICVSAEESPSLLRSSPINQVVLCRLKLLAALIPVWLLALPGFLLLFFRGEGWLLVLIPFLGATLCSAILGLWSYSPTPMNKIFEWRRHGQQRSVFLSLIQSFQGLAWAPFGFLLSKGWWLGCLFCLIGISVLMSIAYLRSRQLGTLLGF
jgi:ABC-2 type transport system permease protein